MNRAYDRVVLIVLDGVGIGALPDAADYGDQGVDTLGHVAQACGGLNLPVLESLGLGRIAKVQGLDSLAQVRGAYGRMLERSCGKDSTTGHWEICGIVQQEPLPTFPGGFPEAVLEAFRQQTGLTPLGNLVASGTEILDLLGEEHLRTGRPILYTSVDSVFQLAAHEDLIPPERLYELCRIARKILDPYRVGRVIARPFVGDAASGFRRTPRRHDFSLAPPGLTLPELLFSGALEVQGIGKVSDIFCDRGFTGSCATKNNQDGMDRTLEALAKLSCGLVFTNLIDFDMCYGHRLDAEGFGRAMEDFDRRLPELMSVMGPRDLLVVTADHGCDPTSPGTDHSREYVPLLLWSPGIRPADLGTRSGFCDLGATLAEAFGLAGELPGTSFLSDLGALRRGPF